MKKSLVLAMAMALGVTASAYAANPFSDVPAGHWAYDSISKLAAAGIIEGYGDDTFRGDRLMTRYEMAQIVAKALAKGANVDKLAAEFADELDALGVRVAALEKKSDNVKITGQARWRYRTDTKGQTDHDLRTRLWFTGKVNDNWNYVSMIENTQVFNGGNEKKSYVGEDDKVYFQRAYLQGRLGGAKITAGRYHEELIGGDSDVYSNRIDGIKAQYGDKVRLMGWYGKMAKLITDGKDHSGDPGNKKSWGAHLGFDLGKAADLFVGYDQLENAKDAKRKIFDVGANVKFGDVKATAIYLHGKRGGTEENKDADKKNGFTIQLAYKGAQAAKPGSWGFLAKYYNQGNLTYVDHAVATGKGAYLPPNHGESGFKGFRLSADYTVAKNMVARVSYFDLKAKDEAAKKSKTYYGEMIITF